MSSESSNVLQATYWTEIGGPHWVRQQPMFDHMLATFGDEALRALAVQPGETVLDVGCGTGTTSLALCAAVGPHGQVFGCDISATMVDAARLRGAPHDCLSFIVADVQTDRLVPGDRLADAVYSRFGGRRWTMPHSPRPRRPCGMPSPIMSSMKPSCSPATPGS